MLNLLKGLAEQSERLEKDQKHLPDPAKAENQIVPLETAELVVVMVEMEQRPPQNWIEGKEQMKKTKHTGKI